FSLCVFFFSSRRRHTRFSRDWSSDVCSSDLVARRLHGFGCKILYTGRRPNEEHAAEAHAGYRTLDDLLAQSDIVTLHCPLTADRSEERRVGKECRSRWSPEQ